MHFKFQKAGLTARLLSTTTPVAKDCTVPSGRIDGRSQLLFYLSYNGTKYNGAAHHQGDWQVRSVMKVMQHHLVKLMGPSRWLQHARVSSRTDKDVHALMNTASVRHSGPVDYSPALLRLMLNASLEAAGEPIRVHLIRPTPLQPGEQHFSLISGVARREYLYRLALLSNPGISLMHPEAAWLGNQRWLVDPTLNIGRLREAAGILSGGHDYTAFTNLQGLRNTYTPLKRLEIRVDDSVSLDPLHACNPFTRECISACVDLHFAARSFLYKQVRFMTGALVAVGRGQVSLDQLRDMLDNPVPYTGVKPYDAAPPFGLYLKRVEYSNPRWNLTWADVLADNATLDRDYCRKLLLRFRNAECPMDVSELTKEHADYVAKQRHNPAAEPSSVDVSVSNV